MKRSQMHFTQIVRHVRLEWRSAWWGTLTCPACTDRPLEGAPCFTCPHWRKLAQEYRDGELIGSTTPKD